VTCRLIQRGASSFSAQCDCTGEWVDLETVDEAAPGFWSWNLRHAWAGHVLTCTGCERSYSLGGVVCASGLPDLIEVDELQEIPRVELTPVQLRLLDVSVTAEDVLWERSMILVRQANAAGNREEAEELDRWARAIRSRCQWEKRSTLRAILDELGIEGFPAALRISRRPDGGGVLYSVDRGPLPGRAKVAEPELVRELDLEDYQVPPVEELVEVGTERFASLDLD